MKRIIKHSGILAAVSGAFTENQIQRKIEQFNSNAADSLQASRALMAQAGGVSKKAGKALKKQARLLRRQSANDEKQARLFQQHIKLNRLQ